jgi:hypothetical protein
MVTADVKTREQLEAEGYVPCQDCWNGVECNCGVNMGYTNYGQTKIEKRKE